MTTWSAADARTGRPEELGWAGKLRVLLTGVSIPRPSNVLSPADRGMEFETHRFANGVGDELEAWLVPVDSARVTSILFHGHAGKKDSMLGVEPDGIVLESTFDRMLSTVASRFQRMHLPATPLAHLLLFWGGVRIGANALAHDPVDYARSVHCPALILQGDRDRNVSLEQARSIQASTAGWSRFSAYAKTGHTDVLSADREQWAADLGALLAQL